MIEQRTRGIAIVLTLACVSGCSRRHVDILFDTKKIELGDVPPDSVTRFTFQFRNESLESTVMVQDIRMSCGCVVVSGVRESVASGDTGTLAFSLNTAGINSGQKVEKQVIVAFNNGYRAGLSVRANVVPDIEIAPKRLEFEKAGQCIELRLRRKMLDKTQFKGIVVSSRSMVQLKESQRGDNLIVLEACLSQPWQDYGRAEGVIVEYRREADVTDRRLFIPIGIARDAFPFRVEPTLIRLVEGGEAIVRVAVVPTVSERMRISQVSHGGTPIDYHMSRAPSGRMNVMISVDDLLPPDKGMLENGMSILVLGISTVSGNVFEYSIPVFRIYGQ